jgi:hypothetical protein
VLLSDLGLGMLIPNFLAQGVTPAVLAKLEDAQLLKLGATSLGARTKLHMAAFAINQQIV